MYEYLVRTFVDLRNWSAMVLVSHLAYPILLFFRSSHDHEAWLNSFGAVMDAATLVMSTVDDKSDGSARLMAKVRNHLGEDLAWFFHYRRCDHPIVAACRYAQGRRR